MWDPDNYFLALTLCWKHFQNVVFLILISSFLQTLQPSRLKPFVPQACSARDIGLIRISARWKKYLMSIDSYRTLTTFATKLRSNSDCLQRPGQTFAGQELLWILSKDHDAMTADASNLVFILLKKGSFIIRWPIQEYGNNTSYMSPCCVLYILRNMYV